MARAIGDAIADGHHAVIEAGTGTGKSLAYLVPALLHWVALGKKVVISTHTIALQEQLFTRDLPLLAACLPIEFIAEKTLGRGNYLGIRRMEHALLRANTLLPGDPERRRVDFRAAGDFLLRQQVDPIARPLLADPCADFRRLQCDTINDEFTAEQFGQACRYVKLLE